MCVIGSLICCAALQATVPAPQATHQQKQGTAVMKETAASNKVRSLSTHMLFISCLMCAAPCMLPLCKLLLCSIFLISVTVSGSLLSYASDAPTCIIYHLTLVHLCYWSINLLWAPAGYSPCTTGHSSAVRRPTPAGDQKGVQTHGFQMPRDVSCVYLRYMSAVP
jgi:hypothetical protein